MKNTSAFTAIELLLVIAVMSILATMSLPAISQAMRKGRLSTAADVIASISDQARQLAQMQPDASGPAYGVALVPGLNEAPARVVFLYGTSATDEALIDTNGDGTGDRPRLSRDLPRGTVVWSGLASAPTPLASRLAWFYQPGTGAVVEHASDQATVSVGTEGASLRKYRYNNGESIYVPSGDAGDAVITALNLGREVGREGGFVSTLTVPPSPITPSLSLRSADGRFRTAIAVYANGMVKATEF